MVFKYFNLKFTDYTLLLFTEKCLITLLWVPQPETAACALLAGNLAVYNKQPSGVL